MINRYFGRRSVLKLIDSPAVIYSAARVEENILCLRNALCLHFNKNSLYYAIKACPFRRILDLMASKGVGFEVQSDDELRLISGLANKGGSVICNGVGKSRAYMEQVATLSHWLVADSLSEWTHAISRARPNVKLRVGLRINPSSATNSRFGGATKLGMSFADATIALETVGVEERDVMIHCHVLNRAKYSKDASEAFGPIVDWLVSLPKRAANQITVLNLGGGIDSRLNIEEAGGTLGDVIDGIARTIAPVLGNREVVLECGRYFVEDAAVGVATVRGTKETYGKRWTIIDMGTNLLVPIPSSRFRLHAADADKSPRYMTSIAA